MLQHHPQAASGAGGREAAIQAIMRRFPMSIGLLSDLDRLDSRIAELIASGRLNAQHTAVRQLLAFADADADEFIKLVARGLNRYNIIKRETCIQLKNITIRLTEKEHN